MGSTVVIGTRVCEQCGVEAAFCKVTASVFGLDITPSHKPALKYNANWNLSSHCCYWVIVQTSTHWLCVECRHKSWKASIIVPTWLNMFGESIPFVVDRFVLHCSQTQVALPPCFSWHVQPNLCPLHGDMSVCLRLHISMDSKCICCRLFKCCIVWCYWRAFVACGGAQIFYSKSRWNETCLLTLFNHQSSDNIGKKK